MGPGTDFIVAEAATNDVGKGVARLSEAAMELLGAVLGDVIEVAGERITAARVSGALHPSVDRTIAIDGLTRENAGTYVGGMVKVRKVSRKTAETVVIGPVDPACVLPDEQDLLHFALLLQGMAVTAGDKVDIPLLGGKARLFTVEGTSPGGGVIVNQRSRFVLKKLDFSADAASRVTYEDIGGLENELRLIREMVELPLRYSEVFEKLGVEAPKGVLLHGPPGTGKTLIARAIAGESGLHFIKINGPEIINRFYGESEARLREIFEEAALRAPSVIFIDEIDAIAPRRAEVLGDVEKRVVAQLLALMDGMVPRGHVVVVGATNIPEVLDPAIRRPGRFDREVAVPAPNGQGRLSILRIHSQRMPLAEDVDLARLSAITHAFVGADLEALCKEAGMVALRRVLEGREGEEIELSYACVENMRITMDDFLVALRAVEPTATREISTERSTITWADIGGLAEVKETLTALVGWPTRYPELFASAKVTPPRGILFSGPPGTGKTLTAKALAGETQLNFIPVSVPVLFSKWLGESEKSLHHVFKKAKQSAPCILFFDDIDTLGSSRRVSQDGEAVAERVASQLFNELDNLTDVSQVIVLGATNRPDLVDPGLRRSGRLDYLIEFSLPSEEDRVDIFRVHTRGKPLAADVDLARLGRLTEGFTGSDIAAVCRNAAMMAIKRRIEGCGAGEAGGVVITMDLLEAAAQAVRKTAESGRTPC